MKNIFYHCLSATLLILVAMTTACTKDETETKKPEGPENEWTDIDTQMGDILQKYYLWNDEYKTLKPDFLLTYNEFLSETLLSMSTNTLDKKLRNGTYRLYSYIQRLSPAGGAAARSAIDNGLQKKQIYSIGAYDMVAIAYTDNSGNQTGEYALVLSGVYPDSPMGRAGIRRGTTLTEVNGQAIIEANLNSIYSMLLSPDPSEQISLTIEETASQPITVTAELMYENPVLCSKVITEGDRKVGYLAYTGFDAAYDDEVLKAFSTFKLEGINEMVLDLRMNGGGHVVSAVMISSCLAGSPCDGKVFQYYRYNDDRMATPDETARRTGMDYDASAKLFYENFIYGYYFDVNLTQYALQLPRVYAIVSARTASASEAVINALRGIGIPVTVIGQRTSGKNVGMESRSLSSDGYDYIFAPITFQGYNALRETVDPAGLTPDREQSDWNNGFADFGELSDPCLAQAMSLITGKSYAPAALRSATAPQVRLAEHITLPDGPDRLQGMILLPHNSK